MKINIGMIGPGRHASLHLAPALQLAPNAQLWSVLSRDLDRAKKFALQHAAASPTPAYTSLEEMLADPELHGVLIASPDKLHVDQAVSAAQAGKHCLVEKPMATDTESCKRMIVAAQENKICLAIAYHLRWHEGHRIVRKEIQSGKIGTIRHIRAQWTWKAEDGSNWRASPDVGKWWSLGGVGTHCLDLIRWLSLDSSKEVTSINAILSSGVWDKPHDETAVIAMKLASGATAEMCSSVLFDSPSRLEVYGEHGYFICEDTLGAKGAGSILTPGGAIEFSIKNPFVGEIENFVDAITTGNEPEVTGEEGLRNVDILSEAARVGGLSCYAV